MYKGEGIDVHSCTLPYLLVRPNRKTGDIPAKTAIDGLAQSTLLRPQRHLLESADLLPLYGLNPLGVMK